MNENLNLLEVLKDCPKGTKLYSTIFGEVSLDYIDFDAEEFPIAVNSKVGHVYFTQTGRYNSYEEQECLLFPSKDQRDWSKFKPKKPKFDPKTLQPFERVICCLEEHSIWQCNLFSHLYPNYKDIDYPVHCMSNTFMYAIPYNDETKHLVGTTEEAPEFYRYWED